MLSFVSVYKFVQKISRNFFRTVLQAINLQEEMSHFMKKFWLTEPVLNLTPKFRVLSVGNTNNQVFGWPRWSNNLCYQLPKVWTLPHDRLVGEEILTLACVSLLSLNRFIKLVNQIEALNQYNESVQLNKCNFWN